MPPPSPEKNRDRRRRAPSRSGVIVLGGAAVLLLGAIVVSWWDESRDYGPRTREAQITGKLPYRGKYQRSAFELLGGLEVGDDVAGWTVRAVIGPRDDTIDVVVDRGALSFSIVVVPRGSVASRPPAQTERFDLVISTPSPPTAQLPPGEGMAVLREIHARIEANEDRPAP